MHAVENTTVNVRLSWQSLQRVAVTLQLEAAKLAIDDSYIDTDRARPHAHFFNDARVGIACMENIQASPHRRSDVRITHGKHSATHAHIEISLCLASR